MTTTPNFEDFQKFSKQQIETVTAVTSTVTKGLQEIAVESTDYSKKAFAESTAVMEKLMGAKSVETAIQIQTDFAKTAYESFVAQVSKINQLFVKLAPSVRRELMYGAWDLLPMMSRRLWFSIKIQMTCL